VAYNYISAFDEPILFVTTKHYDDLLVRGYNKLMVITADNLKKLVEDELKDLNFSVDENGEIIPPIAEKASIRLLHKPSRDSELIKSEKWIRATYPRYQHFYANGFEIEPERIKPSLIRVTENWHGDLFRLSRYYWSIPYSYGFGRRLRYLIIDENNQKLIGIFGLQSAPISFPARDRLFAYAEGRKTEFVNQTMDVFTLGAIPPYNRLLGGKLVALSVTSNEVRHHYTETYFGRVTEMEKRVLPARLVALTTTSAFGKSSIYNRLRYNGIQIAESIGFTGGYGNFHLQRLYPKFKEYLASENISTNGGYGTGPKRTWQLIRRTLDKIGMPADLLKHGIKREAFLFRLIDNLEDYFSGASGNPCYRDLPFVELADYWKKRWLAGRFERVDSWHNWENQEILKSLLVGENSNDERHSK
jgi:hypothetical protein